MEIGAPPSFQPLYTTHQSGLPLPHVRVVDHTEGRSQSVCQSDDQTMEDLVQIL